MSVIAPLKPYERAAVTKAVADSFRGKPIDFAKGVTCIHLLHAQMTAFGYSPPAVPHFETVIGAKRALRKWGHRTIRKLLDDMLERIAAAEMRVGDIALGHGHPFEAVALNAGNGKLLGWRDDGADGLVNIIPTAPLIGAWRLI
jgi:hypothetical protein